METPEDEGQAVRDWNQFLSLSLLHQVAHRPFLTPPHLTR